MSIIAIDKVTIGQNRRALKDQKVSELMQSIQTNGLLNPITLDQNYALVAGLHRLTACKLLGFTEIECKVVHYDSDASARLAEIDENLIRNELEALERSELWLERDQILDRMGLRAHRGDNQYTQQGHEPNSPPLKTTLELAQETGYNHRTFQQGKQIARDIAPEVKKELRGTAIAKSTTALLTVARAGNQARKRAEQAEQASQAAQAKQQQVEAAQQAQVATQARVQQKELQLVALYSAQAEKEAKQAARRSQRPVSAPLPDSLLLEVQMGDEWLLNRHMLYCGDTVSKDFIDRLPSNAALAIITPTPVWQHNYLAAEANIIAVICSEGNIFEFCQQQQMPFRFELLIGKLYIAIFSAHPLLKPEQSINIEGIEGIVTYLVSLYTQPGNFVINPTLGEGEVLMACDRLDRVCFAGDNQPERMNRVLDRWQNWTGKLPQKVDA